MAEIYKWNLGDEPLGITLEAIRIKAGIGAGTAADRVERSPEYIKQVENGRKSPSIPTLIRLLKLYGCRLEVVREEQTGLPAPGASPGSSAEAQGGSYPERVQKPSQIL